MKRKIMAIIAREMGGKIHFLALRNNPIDPIHGGDFYYVVTGSVEAEDKNEEDAVKREVDEETGIKNILTIKKLSLRKEYKDAFGDICKENIYGVVTDQEVEHLNIENIEYKWLSNGEFVQTIRWYGPKEELESLLSEIDPMFPNQQFA
ncbi:MAG: NUDIX domain-containing protein [Microgenomates group bacterium]